MAVDTLVESPQSALSGVARVLVHAGKLIAKGIPARAACTGAIAAALTDDPDMLRAVNELANSLF